MIHSFRCSATEALFNTGTSPSFSAIKRVALRKLDQMHVADVLSDLAVPPGNHLEALQGDRMGQHSIRINDKWRICFVWKNKSAYDVEIVDYH